MRVLRLVAIFALPGDEQLTNERAVEELSRYLNDPTVDPSERLPDMGEEVGKAYDSLFDAITPSFFQAMMKGKRLVCKIVQTQTEVE